MLISEKFVAHRGFQDQFPENTYLSLQKAIDEGARYLELDVQLSKDGHPLIFHDVSLERMCLHQGSVFDYDWEYLRTLSAYEPSRFEDQFISEKIAHLSALRELLRKHPDVQVYVELKKESLKKFTAREIVLAVINSLGDEISRCILISFESELINAAHDLGCQRLGWVLNSWSEVEQAQHCGYPLEVIFCNVNRLNEHVDLSSYPWRWVVYEIDRLDHCLQLFELGVQQVETFNVKQLISEYTEHMNRGR